MDFHDLKRPVEERFKALSKHDLFRVDVEPDALWERYLASFPPGTDPIYRKRTQHDCSCCKNFIRKMGGVVAIVNGEMHSIWGIESTEPAYQAVADAMTVFVHSKPIAEPFLHYEKTVGVNKNTSKVDGKPLETYSHFFVEIPWARNQGRNFFCEKVNLATRLGEQRQLRDLFYRGLTTLTRDAIDTVLDIIKNKSLYRGEQYEGSVKAFSTLKAEFDALPEGQARELYAWDKFRSVHPSVAGIRNTAIGTLLIALSEGVDLEKAVHTFEHSIMAPTNYKRPTALVSAAMVEKARQTVAELGLTDALERRHARLTDISVNDILFADHDARLAMSRDVFDQVATKKSSPKSLDKVETVGIETFIKDIVPNIDNMEVMLENRHAPNLVSLIAPKHANAKSLFAWGNGFSWTYNGEAADSIKERVKRAGGNVTGDLCCRLSWSNLDDLDFHMDEPDGHTIYFQNKGVLSHLGGMLDVDMNAGAGHTRTPVENIFYRSRRTMKHGTYVLRVHQFARRESDNFGFEVEIDWLGEVTHFVYQKPMRDREFVEVAILRYSPSGLEIVASLPSTQASKTIWGLKTNDFHRVTTMMLSPNFWGEGNGSGNKHYFFMLDGAVNDERPRGFFNEFLVDELRPHSKVLEMVGAKMKVEPAADQLSGLGFSSTQRNELLVRAKGTYTRTLKIAF
jgi:hypothetical protein